MSELGTILGFAERRGTTADPTDKKALRALQDASAFIRGYTGQLFDAVTDDTITREGSDRYKLLLPQLPVTAVTDVTEIDSEGTETALDAISYRVDAYGMLRRLDGWAWCSDRDYAVTYNHGYAAVPGDIAALCYELAAENYFATGGGTVTSETIDDYSVTYAAATAGTASLSDPMRRVLDRYRVQQ